MKSRHWAIAAAAILSLSVFVSLAQAQTQTPAQPQARAAAGQALPGTRIALLDVNRIFKSHERFKAAMEGMKHNVEAAETQVRNDRNAITKLGEDLQLLKKGTPDYKALEEELTKRQADLQVAVQLKKNEFVQREAENYNAVYQEILQETNYFCRENAIDVVLRFNGESVDVEQPNSVLSFINRQVVWNNPGLDITDQILQRLNGRAGGAAPATANRANSAAQPARPTVPFNRN
jgi:Skp family chaperone for outer membrane proteins